MVAGACLVVNHSYIMVVVTDVVETEIIPFSFRHKRIDDDAAISLRTQSYDACYHQIVEGRVVVIPTALTVPHKPCAIRLIEILTDIWSAAMVPTLYIHLHIMEELLAAYDRLRVVVYIVCIAVSV